MTRKMTIMKIMTIMTNMTIMKQHDAKVPFAGGGVLRSVLLLMLVVGVNTVWGQIPTDGNGDGYYYILNEKNKENNVAVYYLCPAENPSQFWADNQPFLTTHKAETDMSKFIWLIKKVGDYYYIIHANDYKYLTTNDAPNTSQPHRRRVHLQNFEMLGDDNEFVIAREYDSSTENPLNIHHKTLKESNHMYLTVAGNNANNYGPDDPTSYAGMIGLYSQTSKPYGGDAGSKWTFEFISKCVRPEFEVTENGLSIKSITKDAELYYTTDGSMPTEESTQYTEAIELSATDGKVVRVYAKKDGYTDSEVATYVHNPTFSLTAESFTYNGNVQEPINNIHVGETIIPSSEYTITYKKGDVAVTECKEAGEYTIIVKSNYGSNYYLSASKDFVINPIVTDLNWSTVLEYSGSPQEPIVEIANLVEGDACTVTLSIEGNHTIAGDEFTATILGLTGDEAGNYALPTDETLLTKSYTIIPKSLGMDDGITPAKGISVTMNDSEPFEITVKHGENTLAEGTDYNVSEPVTESGNTKWIISGTGNYGGTIMLMRLSLTFSETEIPIGSNVHDVTTYKASADMTIDGLDAYKVTHINMSTHKVTIKKINYVKKNESLLLLTDLTSAVTNFTATPIYVAEADVEDTSDNLLKVSTPGQTVDFGQVYIYDQGKFIMTTAGTLPENTFYLERTPGSSVSSAPLHIVIDDMTDVEDVRWMMDEGRDDKWYAIDGRRLIGKPTKKGLYIKNGHKVVIK